MTDTNKITEIMARAMVPEEAFLNAAVDVWAQEESANARLDAQAAIDALEQAGYQIVPVEPTGAMMLNVVKQSDERYGGKYSAYGPLQWHYKAMLEAAKAEEER